MEEEIGERTAVARILYNIAVAVLNIESVQIEEEVNKTAQLWICIDVCASRVYHVLSLCLDGLMVADHTVRYPKSIVVENGTLWNW